MLCPNCRNKFDTCGACWGSGYCTEDQYNEYLGQEVRRTEAKALAQLQREEGARLKALLRANSPVPTSFFGKLRWLIGN